MIRTWSKQFLLATGLFGVLLTAQVVSLGIKEKNLARKQLQNAQKTVLLSTQHFEQIN